MRSRTPELFNYDKTQWSPEDGKKQLRDNVTCSMESRDPGKQKAGRAQKLTEDTCASAYQRSLLCKCLQHAIGAVVMAVIGTIKGRVPIVSCRS